MNNAELWGWRVQSPFVLFPLCVYYESENLNWLINCE